MVDPQSAPQIQEMGLCSLNQISLQPCRVKLRFCFWLSSGPPQVQSAVYHWLPKWHSTWSGPKDPLPSQAAVRAKDPCRQGWFAIGFCSSRPRTSGMYSYLATFSTATILFPLGHCDPCQTSSCLVSLPPARHSPRSNRLTPRTTLLRVLQGWASPEVQWSRNCLPI